MGTFKRERKEKLLLSETQFRSKETRPGYCENSSPSIKEDGGGGGDIDKHSKYLCRKIKRGKKVYGVLYAGSVGEQV